MDEPFIFIGTYTIREGKLEALKQYVLEFSNLVEANEPRLLHFGFYFDEDGSEVSVVQVHPDAASMAFHMQVIREHLVGAYEFLDTSKSVQIYGSPPGALVEQMKQASGPAVPVLIKSEFAGFNRLLAMAVGATSRSSSSRRQ